MRKLFGLMLAICLIVPAAPMPAFSAGVIPACTGEKVLRKVVRDFNIAEKIYWKSRGLRLADISDPHQHNHNTYPDSPIERAYCHGTAHFDDGSSRKIHYLVESKKGFAGYGWNVEYCVHGLDPWKYYDGRCRVLSPGE